MNSYLFYDIETTGLSYAFDQVLQFAAIRTDLQFKELQRHEIYVRLRPDVVPSPAAMAAHCLGLSRVTDSGMNEYDAAREIHALLNEPGTISLGYNTLGFDDEFLRFTFHRNLLPPYTHQYANDCGRMDLLPMVVMYWLFRNDILNWPETEERVSLKLEHLKDANSLCEGRPHDALVDVAASVELAKRLAGDREMWDYLAVHFEKNGDRQRLHKLPRLAPEMEARHKLGLMINVDHGAERKYLAPVLLLGYSEHYRNQSLWLRLDRPELREATLESLLESTWVIRKKHGERGIILPPYERFLQRLDPERAAELEENKSWLKAHPELLRAIARFYAEFKYPEIEGTDVDAALYAMDFPTDDELKLCERFHQATFAEKANLLESFARSELRELAKRIIFRNAPAGVTGDLKKEMEAFIYNVNPVFKEEAPVDYRGRKRKTPAEAMEELAELPAERDLDETEKAALRELENYLRQQFIISE